MLEIEWIDTIYLVKVEVIKEDNPIFELPGKIYLEVDKWFPTKPPRPISYRLVEEIEDRKVLIAKFLRKAERKQEYPLKVVQLKPRIVKERLKVKITLEFEDFLAFCGKKAFDLYISDVILGEGGAGEVKEGDLVDIKYRILESTEDTLTLEVDADTSKLGI